MFVSRIVLFCAISNQAVILLTKEIPINVYAIFSTECYLKRCGGNFHASFFKKWKNVWFMDIVSSAIELHS